MRVGLKGVFQASCFGKQQFRSVQLAHAAAARYVDRNIFKCRVCGYWHVSNKQQPRRPRNSMSDGQENERF